MQYEIRSSVTSIEWNSGPVKTLLTSMEIKTKTFESIFVNNVSEWRGWKTIETWRKRPTFSCFDAAISFKNPKNFNWITFPGKINLKIVIQIYLTPKTGEFSKQFAVLKNTQSDSIRPKVFTKKSHRGFRKQGTHFFLTCTLCSYLGAVSRWFCCLDYNWSNNESWCLILKQHHFLVIQKENIQFWEQKLVKRRLEVTKTSISSLTYWR